MRRRPGTMSLMIVLVLLTFCASLAFNHAAYLKRETARLEHVHQRSAIDSAMRNFAVVRPTPEDNARFIHSLEGLVARMQEAEKVLFN